MHNDKDQDNILQPFTIPFVEGSMKMSERHLRELFKELKSKEHIFLDLKGWSELYDDNEGLNDSVHSAS